MILVISLLQTLLFALSIFVWFMIAYIVIIWLVNFDILNYRQPFVAQIYNALHRIFEPIFAPIRRVIPILGGLDLSPIVVIVAVFFLQNLIGSLIVSLG